MDKYLFTDKKNVKCIIYKINSLKSLNSDQQTISK